NVNKMRDILNADFNSVGVSVGTISEFTAENVGSGVLVAGSDALEIEIVDGDGNSQSLNITGTNNMKEVVAKINESAGGLVQASLNDAGKLVLTAQNAESISIGTGLGNGATNAGTAAAATTGLSLSFNE